MFEILDRRRVQRVSATPAELPRHEGIALPVTEPFDWLPDGDLHWNGAQV
ncbi:hypothetical protein AB0F59_29830 [Micromonospora lupini]